ncbi:MAG: PQQ-binding-like beta-propeller repeat protein [Phycisphaerae bacterium]
MRPSTLHCLVLAVVGVVTSSWVLAADPATAPATPAQIKTLVDQLGDKDFKVRAAAERELVRIGVPAIDALGQAAMAGDAEVRQRAARAVNEINAAATVAASRELAKGLIWSYPIKNGGIGAPAVSGGSAYAVGKDMQLHRVDIRTGKKVWAVDLKDRAFGSEIFAGPKVVFLTQGMVLTAFNVADGKQLWQKDMNAPPPGGGKRTEFLAGRLAAWNMGDTVVAQADADSFKGFKAMTGEEAWECKVKRPEGWPAAPAMAGGVLFAKTGQSIAAIDLATRKEIWRQDKDVAGCTAMGAGGGALCCLAGDKIVALDAKKGERLWTADAPGRGEGPGRGAPGAVRVERLVADDTNLYLALAGGGALAAYDLRKGDMRVLNLDMGVAMDEAQRKAAGMADTGDVKPVVWGFTWWSVSGGTLYAASEIAMFAFDIKTSKRLWTLLLDDPLSGEMAVADGVIYFATDYRPKPQTPGAKDASPLIAPGLHAMIVPKN